MNQPTYYAPYYGAPQDQLTAYKQPYQQMPQSYAPQQPTTPQNSMIWVQGEAAAKSWAVAPGAMVILWDSENPFIYIKYADTSGIPYMRTLRWEDYSQKTEPNNTENFAPMEAVKELEKKITELEERIKTINMKEEK